MLKGCNILLGITGGIAAYKSALLVRMFVKAGANVKVIMTSASKEFITPLTLSVLSKNTVLSDFADEDSGDWNSHVELGRWADVMLIAPATANTLAKMANGICDNLLLAVYLSTPQKRVPVFYAPAMDIDMYKHPATGKNLEKLKTYGNIIINPEEGELASGLIGKGRMAEPETIYAQIEKFLTKNRKLSGKKALVTAGPTHEAIDPVRFISNQSSGKMGFAIADELAREGAEVKLISGPVQLNVNRSNIKQVDVTTAEEMYNACVEGFSSTDIAVMCAAVADYSPATVASNKIKKKQDGDTIRVKPTKDILYELGNRKSKNQLLVGFALETENEVINAKTKLKKKNLDFIVLNSLKDSGAGFRHNTNKVTIIDRNNKTTSFKLKSKQEVAEDIVDKIISLKR